MVAAEGNHKKKLSEVVLCNPKIVEMSKAVDTEVEACLSFPGMQGLVQRSTWLRIQAFTLEGTAN